MPADNLPAVYVDPVIIAGLTEQDVVFVREMSVHDSPLAAVWRSGHRMGALTMVEVGRCLMERPEIKRAIALMKRRREQLHEMPVSVESQTAISQSILEEALEKRDLASANTAAKHISQLHGLLESKVAITVRRSVEEMTDDELRAIVAKGRVIDAEFTVPTEPAAVAGIGGTEDGEVIEAE